MKLNQLPDTDIDEVEELRKELNKLRAAVVLMVNCFGIQSFKEKSNRLTKLLTEPGMPGPRIRR